MSKFPTHSKNWWKKRIEEAKTHNEGFIFYQVEGGVWKEINTAHKNIIEKLGIVGRVLDAGCGTGRLSEWFDAYTGVDFSPDLLEMARKKRPDKDFVEADLKNLPFKDHEFDWAICVSIRDMVIRDSGLGEWKAMKQELLRVADKILILDYPEPEEYEIVCQ